MKISDKTKRKQKRGEGTGANYSPWIQVREMTRDLGIRSLVIDWKTGRQVHLLSLNEVHWYYITRWRDDVIDIREQFPLDKEKTDWIADHLHVQEPAGVMTTDMLVTYLDENGIKKEKAYSVKNSYKDVFGDISDPKVLRRVELLRIEMAYWRLKNIDYEIIFGDRQINKIFAENIAIVIDMYNADKVMNRQDFLCYLIAHKYLKIETMETQPLDFVKLTEQYLGTETQRKEWMEKIGKNTEKLDRLL